MSRKRSLEELAREILDAWVGGRDPASLQPVWVRTSTRASLKPDDVVRTYGHAVELAPGRVAKR
jgi:hypothetical protein